MEKTLKPALRFKGFTDAWEQRKLGEECQYIVAGGDVDKELIKTVGKHPVIANALTNEGIIGYYDSFYRIEAPALTVTGRGDVGHAKARKTSFTPVVRLLTAKTFHDVDFLENAVNQKGFVVESTGVPQLTVPKLQELELDFPTDINEELSIGDLFVSLNNLITLHQRKYDKLINVKKALLDKMFPKNGELVPQLRFKGFADTWEQCKLGDLGFFKSNGVDKLSKPNEFSVNLLNYMDIYNRRQVTNKNAHELMQVTAKPNQLIENSIQKNDVFFTPTSETPEDIGRVYVIEETLNNTVYSYHLMRFRPNQGTYYPNFPNHSLMTENVRKQFFLAAKGVQRYVISKADFESIKDVIPEYGEQAKIGEFFRSIDKLITLHQRKYEKLVNIKKALLQKMFV